MLERMRERLHELESELEALEAEWAMVRFENDELERRIRGYEKEVEDLRLDIRNILAMDGGE